MSRILLYHAGFLEIRVPQVHRGRKNADFGQGFYLSEDRAFTERWAKDRPGVQTWINTYELNTAGLRIKTFERDEAWFRYICQNRAGYADAFAKWDIIVGPIANDTIYNTWGIISSGLLDDALALRLLRIGPLYRQTVIKTERAAAQLQWISARVPEQEEIAQYRSVVAREEAAYQQAAADIISSQEALS